MVAEGAEIYRREGCDFLVGLGGGSPMDCAKAIGVALTDDRPLRDLMTGQIRRPIPPLAAIPTTAGTGSETTAVTIISDRQTQVKMLLKGDALMPRIAVVDPDLSRNVPESVAAASGLDALTHAIEAYTSRRAFEISDQFALSAIARIFANIEAACAGDAKARAQMALGSYEAGVSFGNSSVTIVHGMSRPIGALFHVPHGLSNAMLLPDCLEFALDGALERFAALGRRIGAAGDIDSDARAAEKFADAVRGLCARCKVPTLRQYGVNLEEFARMTDKMATDALASGSPANTRKEVGKEDVIKIYNRVASL